jgi:hypothetical protein
MSQINAEFGRGNDLNSYRNTVYYSGGSGPYYFPSSNIAFSNFYGTSAFIPLTVTAWVIGGGGRSRQDTSGGSGGGGAAVVQTTLTATANTLTVVVGSGGTSYGQSGGSSSVVNATLGVNAIGGGGNANNSGPSCGGCTDGQPVAGGSASGGNLNLTGGTGSGYNQIYVVCSCCSPNYYQTDGSPGASGTFNSITYYAAGGGGASSDYYSQTGGPVILGGAGGGSAGAGGNGYFRSYGASGNNYGGGSGGGGNNNQGCGVGAQGVVIITYTASSQLGSGGTVTNVGSVWTHTFTSSGTFTAL